MKHSLCAAALLLCMANPLVAGGPTVVEDAVVFPPFPDATPRPDWSGVYAGLSLGRTSGDLGYENPASTYDIEAGSIRSLFLGYRLQQGDLVYGAEVEMARLSDTMVEGFPEELSETLDVKGSLGYATGRFLTYGVLGWSQVKFDRAADSGYFGGIMSYGVGVEYSINDNFGLGVEYLARNVDGISLNGSPQSTTIDANSLSLRLGLSF